MNFSTLNELICLVGSSCGFSCFLGYILIEVRHIITHTMLELTHVCLCKLCSLGVPFLPLLKTLLLEIQTLPRIKARIAPISLCRQQSIKVWYLYPCEIVCDRIREKGSILQNRIINLQLLVPGQRTCNYPQNGM